MARVQSYSGKPFVSRAAIGATTVEVVFPNPTKPTTPVGNVSVRPGHAVSIWVQATGAALQVCFDGDFATNYYTIPINTATRFTVDCERIWIKGVASSVYELVAEISY
jgi:hypothetical protein